MTWLPRFDFRGIPQPVVQHGNNRLPCFPDDEDRQNYLQCLLQALKRFGPKLLCVDGQPRASAGRAGEAGALSRLMHTFSRNYVARCDDRYGRTGTLWEGSIHFCRHHRSYGALGMVHACGFWRNDLQEWNSKPPQWYFTQAHPKTKTGPESTF